MNAARIKLKGSNYIGLFSICNDNLCFVPEGIEERALKTIEQTLEVKAVKINMYDSSLLSVFAKMNNKFCVLPNILKPKEIETVEKEIKVKIIKTEQALGNLIELNDNGVIISKTASKNVVDELKKEKLETIQMNLGKTDAIGSALLATNKGFVGGDINEEEAKKISETLKVQGGISTANTGDTMIRNSVIANTKGFIAGESTTGFELNRIEEAIEGKE